MVKSLKYLFITLCTALSLGSPPVFSAGTLPLAMAQQIDINGQPLAGCLVSFFVAGTVATPQNNYADFGLTAAQANPLQCDQSGRVPMFWLADGLIHVRLTDSQGTPIIDTTMQVLGPSSGGGGGGGTVDPTAIMSTGDIKAKYGTGPLSGFVRCNALTIGNAVSGASERANADTQALFIYLYGNDPNLVVSGGRSGNALNDFNANKTITMPDWRGRTLGGLADMGNSATTALTAAGFGNSVTVLGSSGGGQNYTLLATNLPPHSHNGSGTTGSENANHVHTGSGTTSTMSANASHSHTANASTIGIVLGGGGPGQAWAQAGASAGATFTTDAVNINHTHTFGFTSATESAVHQHSFAFTTDNGPGASSPFPVIPPMVLTTLYMKL